MYQERRNLMREEKEKVVIDGNAFYEIDLECLRAKEKEEERKKEEYKKRKQRD